MKRIRLIAAIAVASLGAAPARLELERFAPEQRAEALSNSIETVGADRRANEASIRCLEWEVVTHTDVKGPPPLSRRTPGPRAIAPRPSGGVSARSSDLARICERLTYDSTAPPRPA